MVTSYVGYYLKMQVLYVPVLKKKDHYSFMDTDTKQHGLAL